jgi:hypothetical protein
MLKAPTSEPEQLFCCYMLDADHFLVWLKSLLSQHFVVAQPCSHLAINCGKFKRRLRCWNSMQSGQQPATVNLKVDMVAQHGQDPSLQFAVPGISPGASNDEKKDEPESRRGRGSGPPRMGKRAASNSRDSASPRRFIH